MTDNAIQQHTQTENPDLIRMDSESTAIDVRRETAALIHDTHPIFQRAWEAAQTNEEKNAITNHWEQFQIVLTNVNTATEGMMTAIVTLHNQQTATVHELDQLVTELQQAASDHYRYPLPEHLASHYEMERHYRGEVSNLIDAVNSNARSELEYERAGLAEEVHRDVVSNLYGNMAAIICGILETDDYPAARAAIDFILKRDQSDEQRHAAAGIFRALAEKADE